MDFLDSLNLDTIDKKSHRVRSWYLYEQFKSLERSQLDAAQKLKDRSYQERILRQELSERRARRKLYDQFGLCQSDSRIKKSIKSESAKSSVSASNDDFFESFCDLQEDEDAPPVSGNEFSDDALSAQGASEHLGLLESKCSIDDCKSHQGLSASEYCIDDYKSVEDHNDDNSFTGSINSVVENFNLVYDICQQPKEMEFPAKSIVDNINTQLESVKEDIKCLEEFTQLEDVDKISEDASLNTEEDCESKHVTIDEKNDPEYNNNIIAIWSRLVSFAYQLVQLNHGDCLRQLRPGIHMLGNCYCDYSSQFLTAVLACDILRRGVNRMCHILQPYVSPIKFATDGMDVSNESFKNVSRKKSEQLRKCRKTYENKPLVNKKVKTTKIRYADRKYSENCWQHPGEYRKVSRKNRRASEPWRSVANFYTSKEGADMLSSSSSSIWPHDTKERVSRNHYCCCHKKAVNPMLNIAQYIDSILNDIGADSAKHCTNFNYA